eukprot:COSAG01_NODE_28213_length_666_cov_1.250441_1_plen_171_part_10
MDRCRAVRCQVGDPGADRHLAGRALQRNLITSKQDEAAIKHLQRQAIRYAHEAGRYLACLRKRCWDGGGQEALVDVSRYSLAAKCVMTMTEPYIAKVEDVGPRKDVVYCRVVLPAGGCRGPAGHCYGETPGNGQMRIRVKLPATLYPEESSDQQYIQVFPSPPPPPTPLSL